MRVTSKFKGSQHHVTIPAPSLASYFIAEAAESTSEVFTAYIAGKFQAGITSSLTMWSRMTLGFSVGSKWQETASLIIVQLYPAGAPRPEGFASPVEGKTQT